MLSCVSFGSAFGIAIYAPIFGYMTDLFNIAVAMRLTAMFTAIAVILVLFVKDN